MLDKYVSENNSKRDAPSLQKSSNDSEPLRYDLIVVKYFCIISGSD